MWIRFIHGKLWHIDNPKTFYCSTLCNRIYAGADKTRYSTPEDNICPVCVKRLKRWMAHLLRNPFNRSNMEVV